MYNKTIKASFPFILNSFENQILTPFLQLENLTIIILIVMFLLSGITVNAECIGLVTAGGGLDYWGDVKKGAKKAGKELGIKVHVRGAVDEANEQAQYMLINMMIKKKGCRGLILAANSEDRKKDVAQLKSLGIPTVYIDRDIGGERICVIKTNSFHAGELAGREMAKALRGKGKVAIFRERKKAEPTTSRENGFIKAAVKGGLDVVVDEVVGTMVGEVRTKVSKILRRTKHLDGIFTPNESTTIGTIATLKKFKLAGKVVHIGFDSTKFIIEALRCNQLYGIILQNPYEMGYQGVYTIYRAMKGKSIKTDIETKVVFVNRDNLNNAKIKEMIGLDQDN